MSERFCRDLPSIGRSTLSRRLLDGVQGCWNIEGLGPLEVRGEGRVGRLLVAHGAGAGQDSTFMQRLREGLATVGVQTLAFEFDYLRTMRREGRRSPPPRVERLVDEMALWCDSMSHRDLPPLWWGGKSMGGRVASMLAARDSHRASARGLVLCGYPFHPPATPERLRLAHWPSLACPTLVVQGSRDPFGTREQVAGYALPEVADLRWLADGDHDWTPRRASGRDQATLITEACAAIAAFMHEHS